MTYLICAALIIGAYLLGSIPFGLILVKILGRGDIRAVGSGNVGATNVARVIGLPGFVLTFVLDLSKAVAAVVLGRYFVSPEFGALCGFFAIVGHCFPLWLKFQGGKGNSSMFGVLLAVNPLMFIVVGIEWLIVAMASGYSSLGAIIGFWVMPVLGFAMNAETGLIFIAIAALCLWQHRGNIDRLLKGTESTMQMNPKKLAFALIGIGVLAAGIIAFLYYV